MTNIIIGLVFGLIALILVCVNKIILADFLIIMLLSLLLINSNKE